MSKRKFKVKDVRFLVPVSVEYQLDDNTHYAAAQIDYARRELYISDDDLPMGVVRSVFEGGVFDHLAGVTRPPEDVFEAEERIYEEVAKTQQQFEQVKQEQGT